MNCLHAERQPLLALGRQPLGSMLSMAMAHPSLGRSDPPIAGPSISNIEDAEIPRLAYPSRGFEHPIGAWHAEAHADAA